VHDDFSTLFEFLPIGAYRSLPDGRQLRANPALVCLNGYDSEAALLEGVRDIAVEWYVQPGRRQEFVDRLLAAGRLVGFESEIYRHRTRERIWISENAHVVRDAQGAVLYYEGTVEDISDRVAAREALFRSQRELEQIVALVPGMVYRVIVLPDGGRRPTFVSAGVRELFELEPEEVLSDGKLMHHLRHVDDRERMRTVTTKAARERLPVTMDYRVQLKSGRIKWVQMLSAAAPPENGHEVRVGMVLDITERKQSEQALLENSQLWKRALESSGDGVWDWLVQEGVEVLSPACKALYGFAEDELPDTPGALDERTHPEDLPTMRIARENHFAGRTPSYVSEHRVQCKDGQWKWILSRGIVIQRDAQGRPLRMVGTHTDITAAREAEALRHERDRAAAADLAKSQFLSRVSHELRTPLNAILGFAQLLEMQPGDTERQRRWVRQVLASGEHLLALVDDVLDLSAVQTGELRLRTEALALPPLVGEALAMLHGVALDADVVVHDDSAGDWTVLADRRRFVQVVSNLVSNAIKYNQRGGWVRVAARCEGDEVLVLVSDSGPGLSESQQARLFQPFERLDAPRGTVSGTGLGLALVRQFTEAMGGSITVDSAPGRGATFTVRLPAA
jgi:PAS domain S-box-containing protein